MPLQGCSPDFQARDMRPQDSKDIPWGISLVGQDNSLRLIEQVCNPSRLVTVKDQTQVHQDQNRPGAESSIPSAVGSLIKER
jgi:hypothetical protein